MNKKLLSIILFVTIIFANCYTVSAVTSADYRKQADEAQSKSEETEDRLEEVEGELNVALQEVQDLNTSISEVETEISSLSEEIDELNISIKEKETDLEEKQNLLDERLSAAYMNGDNTYLEALFSGGFFNFISNYDMIKQIAEYDTILINEVKEAKQELENEKIKIENVKVEKETKNKELKKLKDEKQQKVNNLTEEQKQLQTQMEEYENQMAILRKKEQEQAAIEAEQAKANSNSGSNSAPVQSTGQFLWPVPSSRNISSKYGYRIHPIYGTKKLHAGLDIAAAGGADIVAADSGTVMLSSFGYNGGYGNYIIINHGNGVTTRYAHCSDLYVSAGQTVTKGQRIAAVGSTGASTGNHCHFEVRINGESKNPSNYL